MAELMATSEASVKSALQRARATLAGRLPDRGRQVTLRELGDARIGRIVREYVDAFKPGDVDALVGQLAEVLSLVSRARGVRGGALEELRVHER